MIFETNSGVKTTENNNLRDTHYFKALMFIVHEDFWA
jgi:hypothetical protein